jgi:hypothetical protein
VKELEPGSEMVIWLYIDDVQGDFCELFDGVRSVVLRAVFRLVCFFVW